LADPAQLDAVVVDLETEGRGVGYRQSVQAIIFEIDELVTAEAHQVMVELEARIVAGDPTGVAGLGDHTHVGEVLEGSVDRGAGDAGEAISDGVEDPVSGRVVVEVEDRFEDDPALHRATLAALAAEPFEILDALLFHGFVQAAAPRFSPSLMMTLNENM
jgi:hypothetical protein